MDIRDSSTYWAILEEGRIDGLQQILLRLGQQKFGTPTHGITTAITAITDRERLERMRDRLLIVTTWDELLATP